MLHGAINTHTALTTTKLVRGVLIMAVKKHIKKQVRSLTVYNQHRSESKTNVPLIHLSGIWLLDAGFSVSSRVKVRVMEGCLVLTRESEEESKSYHQLQEILKTLKAMPT